MSETAAASKLRIRARSLLVAWIIVIAPTLVGVWLLSAQRILMWIVTAATLAGLLYPLARFFDRFIPKGFAVLLTMLLFWTTIGYGTYSIVDDLTRQAKNLENVAPKIIENYEHGKSSTARLARDAQLSHRAQVFFNELPNRLRGGEPAKAIRGVATRAVITLVINVMAIFFMLHTSKLATGLLSTITDDRERFRWTRILFRTYERAFAYLRGSVGMALVAGGAAYLAAHLAKVPSPFPLAVFAAVWDLIPVFGVAIGALPIALLAAPNSEMTAIAIVLGAIIYQVAESWIVQPRVENASVKPGPFISFVALFGGLEAFGAGGMFLGIVMVTLVVTFLDELFPDVAREPQRKVAIDKAVKAAKA